MCAHQDVSAESALLAENNMLDITTATLAPQHGYVLLTLLVSVFTYDACLIKQLRLSRGMILDVVIVQGAHVYACESRNSSQNVRLNSFHTCMLYVLDHALVVCNIMCHRRYGVKYPALYADSSNSNAEAFNCVQRGHQNTLEGYPLFLALLFASGIQVKQQHARHASCSAMYAMLTLCCLAVPYCCFSGWSDLHCWPCSLLSGKLTKVLPSVTVEQTTPYSHCCRSDNAMTKIA